MAEHGERREPDIRQIKAVAGDGPRVQPGEQTIKWCAYNQTRERFLSASVEVLASSAVNIDARLPALRPGSGAALWMVPAQPISATSLRLPIDLLYLDQNQVVLETIESFPISGPSFPNSLATSVLALPADTVASGMIHSGDCLVVCPPDEMKLRLEKWGGAHSETPIDPKGKLTQSIGPDSDQPGGGATGHVLTPGDHLLVESYSGRSPAPEAATPRTIEEHAPTPAKGSKKNWFHRLLWGDPPEPRKASRESLSWLIAYFFTGGSPVAHEVRDVSRTGLYVVTEERWYLDTVVRITLTDRRDPSIDRSLTLNARVVRVGSDGVALEFLLEENRGADPCIAGAPGDGLMQVNKVQIERFLQGHRSNKG